MQGLRQQQIACFLGDTLHQTDRGSCQVTGAPRQHAGHTRPKTSVVDMDRRTTHGGLRGFKV